MFGVDAMNDSQFFVRRVKRGSQRRKQRGITLVIVLILLVVLTILGVGGMRATRIQEQIASARYEHVTSVATAHAGAADGRDYVYGPFDPKDPGSKVQAYADYLGTANEGWTVDQWVRADTNWLTGANILNFGDSRPSARYNFMRTEVQAPTYIVQELVPTTTNLGDTYYAYRVTARGEGARAENSSYVQTFHRLSVAVSN
jgi:type IV pilus assembly protein PilX